MPLPDSANSFLLFRALFAPDLFGSLDLPIRKDGSLFWTVPPMFYRIHSARSHEADEKRRSRKVCSPRSTLTKRLFSTSCFSRADFSSGGLLTNKNAFCSMKFRICSMFALHRKKSLSNS
ncbi:hypothetical protein TNIN_443971 [Trichonephila inaurata madagascariensis]|uniref:Uncharacterized protein n=1 Tax=Trichonephila inaurata madagascariensis TaxID=2747483 RepID=A0A8X6I4M8_9ARAC|nr:hypothetical protein TNIN_443971 [Trichonephila inaurata madagascariensis]